MSDESLPSWVGPALGFVCAPLALGLVARVKAAFAGRTGPPLTQPYRDLAKRLRKGSVISRTTGPHFALGPAVSLAGGALAVVLLPAAGVAPALSFPGDLVVFAYVLAVGRFFTVLAALDTGSAFEGLGASREAWFGALAEPALFVALAVAARSAHAESIAGAFGGTAFGDPLPLALAIAALGAVFLVENSRVPADDPTTHLELTMVHEVMALDHGGVDLAAIEYARALKFWALAGVVGGMLPRPEGALAGLASHAAGILAVALATGVVESTRARLRLQRVTQLLLGAGACAALAALATLR